MPRFYEFRSFILDEQSLEDEKLRLTDQLMREVDELEDDEPLPEMKRIDTRKYRYEVPCLVDLDAVVYARMSYLDNLETLGQGTQLELSNGQMHFVLEDYNDIIKLLNVSTQTLPNQGDSGNN